MRTRVTYLTIAVALLAAAPLWAQSISDAKLLPNGAFVRLSGKVASTGSADFTKRLQQFQAGVSVGTVQSTAVNEASGIVASRKNANVLWVHNDSGDSARVFAMSTSGTHLGIYNLTGKTARDWEDIALGPGPTTGASYLYVGDIGDNSAVRASIVVYRLAEPTVSSTQPPVVVNLTAVETFTLQYEDGARDAETLMVDPTNGDLYVVSKREAQSRLYRAAASSLTTTGTVILHRVATLPWGGATGGDISPDGSEVLIRGYGNASVWVRPPGGSLWSAFSGTQYTVPLASEPQGEAVGFAADGRGYYTTSEYANQPIYYYARVPDVTRGCLYIQEPGRSCGIRVATSTSSVSGLARGCTVDVEGNLGTTATDEREITGATVLVIAPPGSDPRPLGMINTRLGGGGWGNPAGGLGQWGVTGGAGVNNVGLLVAVWGLVTYVDPAGAYFVLDDGGGRPVRVDTSLVSTSVTAGSYARACGVCSLLNMGASKWRLVLPRADADLAVIR